MTSPPSPTFSSLLADSVIVQAIITVACVGAVIYLALTQLPIPDLLRDLTWAVVGIWVGSRAQLYASRYLHPKG